jgi:hypothetical protein
VPVSREPRERLALLRKRLREAEEAMLAERQKEQELQRAYSQAQRIRPGAVPRNFHQQRGQ